MLKDRLYDYFITKDYNCAESMLHAISDEFGLELSNESYKLIGGFGGGMGCGNVCGALSACIAAFGVMTITDRAHATPDFKEKCAELVKRFSDALGETACSVLKPKYGKEDTRCMDAVTLAADVFEDYMKTQKQ